MKNVVIGIFSALIVVYVVAICLTLYNINARKNHIENITSDVMYEHLKKHYGSSTVSSEKLKKEIENRLDFIKEKDELKINISKYNLAKGLIIAEIQDKYRIFSGKIKNIKIKKIIIFDKEDIKLKEKNQYRNLIFYVKDKIYKKVRLKVGSTYVVPKFDLDAFLEEDKATNETVKSKILIKQGEIIRISNEMPENNIYLLDLEK
ncbi:hypothetical protein [Lachnobacterium bovis]|uniref:hypothetical protein n=1 Tax=Lachnobacterium bovis TaxID=140626 RepID=UPI00048A97ED|nr:hypothetical protein [Lachnobacterium bovis]